jgi:hypothetical protein
MFFPFLCKYKSQHNAETISKQIEGFTQTFKNYGGILPEYRQKVHG